MRHPTLAPQLEKTHEMPPSSRDEGLLFLHLGPKRGLQEYGHLGLEHLSSSLSVCVTQWSVDPPTLSKGNQLPHAGRKGQKEIDSCGGTTCH